MSIHAGYLGILAVIGLMGLTLYMAFAFPYTLFQLKGSDSSELKSVFIVGRDGEHTPVLEAFFRGEQPPVELASQGQLQLTNAGKERMYLLGKYLKVRYYEPLLQGDPRKVYAASPVTSRALESAQALVTGLNPPKDGSIWSSSAGQLASDWQPIAVYPMSSAQQASLKEIQSCPRMQLAKLAWKNSTNYQRLQAEFRSDLDTLSSNSGLKLEPGNELDLAVRLHDLLEARRAFKPNSTPAWYTETLADRHEKLVSQSIHSQLESSDSKRLLAGPLLHELIYHVNQKIGQQKHQSQTDMNVRSSGDETNNEPANVFIYLTDKQRLAALMSSLQIRWDNIANFGSLLLVELHYSPLNQAHFLRMFTLNSASINIVAEPIRVNPLFCADLAECAPNQLEQSITHLLLSDRSWSQACMVDPMPVDSSNTSNTGFTVLPTIEPIRGTSTMATEERTSAPVSETRSTSDSSHQTITQTPAVATGSSVAPERSIQQSSPTTPIIQTQTALEPDTSTGSSTSDSSESASLATSAELASLDAHLIVGPTHADTTLGSTEPNKNSNTISTTTTTTTSTTGKSSISSREAAAQWFAAQAA